VHQFVRIGRLALLRGLSRTSRDVPPFCIMDGTHTVRTLNRIGLERAGFPPDRIREIKRAFTALFRKQRSVRVVVAELASQPCCEEVRHLLEFIRASERGVCSGPRRKLATDDAD